MNIIAICNLKGGVGKTVTAVQLGAGLARRRRRVLLVDVDLQHGLTSYFDLDVRGRTTTAEVLLDGKNIGDAAMPVRSNLDVLPATARMEIADAEMPHLAGGDLRLRAALKIVTGYDYILVDCPSGWGAVVRNAIVAATHLLMPINSELLAFKSALETQRKAVELCGYLDHSIELLGPLLTCCRNTKISNSVAANSQRQWPGQILTTHIRRAERINELPAFQQTIFDSDGMKNSPVGEDYEALTAEVMKRCEGKTKKLSATSKV